MTCISDNILHLCSKQFCFWLIQCPKYCLSRKALSFDIFLNLNKYKCLNICVKVVRYKCPLVGCESRQDVNREIDIFVQHLVRWLCHWMLYDGSIFETLLNESSFVLHTDMNKHRRVLSNSKENNSNWTLQLFGLNRFWKFLSIYRDIEYRNSVRKIAQWFAQFAPQFMIRILSITRYNNLCSCVFPRFPQKTSNFIAYNHEMSKRLKLSIKIFYKLMHSWSVNRHVDDVSPPLKSIVPIILFDWPKVHFSQSCESEICKGG